MPPEGLAPPLDLDEAAARARALDRATYEISERICHLAEEVLDLGERGANSEASSSALFSGAVLLAAAARTLLARERAPVPSTGAEVRSLYPQDESERVKRSRRRAEKWHARVLAGNAPAPMESSSGPLPPGRVD